MSDAFLPDPGTDSATRRTRSLRWVSLLLVLVLAAWGIADRLHARSRLAETTREAAIPVIMTIKPAPSEDGETLLLAGNTQAFSEASIYARTSGYIKSWSKDIGAHVRKGTELAVIETPEVDQQARQAQADLDTARAAYEISRTTNERWQGLVATDSVSRQDAEQKSADAMMKKAALQSAEANLARLRELQQFKRIVAPFDGVITQRATDIGALVAAGQNAGAPLFRIADVRRLRIYSTVPEHFAAQVAVGAQAEVHFDGRPGSYVAKVVSTAEAIDPGTRTLQIEMQMDNGRGGLLPGMYARVRFDLGPRSGLPRIPVTALMFRSDGLWVATLPDGHRAHLKKVVPARDFGTEIEIREGLDVADVVIANPPDSLMEGSEVRISSGKGH